MDDLREELTHFITRRFVYFFAGQQIGDEIDVGVERSSRGLIDLRMTGASARYSQRLRIILRPLEKENEGNLATQVVPSDQNLSLRSIGLFSSNFMHLLIMSLDTIHV